MAMEFITTINTHGAALLGPVWPLAWTMMKIMAVTAPLMLLSWPAQPASAAAWAGFAYVTLFSMWLGFFAWYRGLALGGTVLISTNTGDNLCIGHSPESTGAYLDLNDLCGGGYQNRKLPEIPFVLRHGDVAQWAALLADRSVTLRGPVGEIVMAIYGRVTRGLEIEGAQPDVDAFLSYPR